MPNCGRCVKRGKLDKCVYHPAPLTKSGAATPRRIASPCQPPFSMEDERTSSQSPSQTGYLPTNSAYLDHLASTDRPKSLLPFPRSAQYERGFIASTSASLTQSQCNQADSKTVDRVTRTDAQVMEDAAAFICHSAVVAENELSVGLSPPESMPGSRISQEHIERGVSVLVLLKDLPSIQNYINKWFSFAGGVVVIEPMVKIYIDGLRATWHKILESSRAADIQFMSGKIWENTSKPVSRLLKRDTTPHEFCSSVTGPNLRWEVIGLLVSLVSLVTQSLKGVLSLRTYS